MKKILAFDLGSSSGRAIEGKYTDGKLQYKEIHRFKNVPIWHNGHLCWDFEKIMQEKSTASALMHGVQILVCWIRMEICCLFLYTIETFVQKV